MPGADFASILGGCRPLFPAGLLDSAGWGRLLGRAKLLPRSVIDAHFGFEFHLGEPGRDADLFVVLRPGSGLWRHYVREGARAEPGSAAAALAAGLRQQAGNPDSYFARSVAAAVLEYDLAGLAPGGSPPPGVFLAPRRSAPGAREGVAEHRDPAALVAALAAVAGWSVRKEVLRRVARVFQALPDSAFVFQAGALPGRSPKAFRILLKGVAGDAVPALLERLEWPGRAEAAAEALAVMDDLVSRVAVSMDVTARGPAPRLGLELYRPVKWHAVDRAGWLPVIDRIEERGWCLPEKAGGLRRWPGVERLLGGGEAHFVRQGIDHVKLVVAPGARIAAKAYAGMDVRTYWPPRGESGLTPPPRHVTRAASFQGGTGHGNAEGIADEGHGEGGRGRGFPRPAAQRSEGCPRTGAGRRHSGVHVDRGA